MCYNLIIAGYSVSTKQDILSQIESNCGLNKMKDYYPKRIAGISGYTVRSPHARQAHPKISAFTSAKIDKSLDLKPDLAIKP